MTETPSHSASAETPDEAAHHDDRSVDYLDREINLFRPATPFMRANLRMIFLLCVIWTLFIFGPVTASYFAPEFMTETRVLGGYPLNFFLTAFVAPGAALGLAGVYAWYRDRLDEQFGVPSEQGDHS